MKIKLADHHIAGIKDRAEGLYETRESLLFEIPIVACRRDILALLEHVDAITEELREKQEFLNSLPDGVWEALAIDELERS